MAFRCSMAFNGCHPVASRMMTWQGEWASSLKSSTKSSRSCRMTRWSKCEHPIFALCRLKLISIIRGSYRQNELKEGAQRSVGKQYYYIDYEHFCNVVKWRIARMRSIIDTGLRNVHPFLPQTFTIAISDFCTSLL